MTPHHLGFKDARRFMRVVDFLFSDGLIRALQQYSSPWLDAFFVFVTTTGGGLVLFALGVVVYWYIDRKVGFLLAAVFLVSSVVNGRLKDLLAMPRPPVDVRKVDAGGFGFPSGHAQQTTATWLVAAIRLQGIWIPLAALAIPLVALSRVYLGVHYVGDVLGGIAIGLAVGTICELAARKVPWARLTDLWKLVIGVGVPIGGAAVLALARQPVSTSLARLAGAAAGFLFQEKWIRLGRPADWASLILRTAIGAPAFVALLSTASRIGDGLAGLGFEFLVGLAVFGVLPWVFLRVEKFVAERGLRPRPTPGGEGR